MQSRFYAMFILLYGIYHPNWVHAEPVHYDVNVPAVVHTSKSYIDDLLLLCLNSTKTDNEIIDLNIITNSFSQSRQLAELQTDLSKTVFMSTTTKAREQVLRPVRVPLFKGLYGYRVLVIRKQDEARFAKVTSLEDLAKFSAGQGRDWPDTDILRANQLSVVTSLDEQHLYKMLAVNRFDYFALGLAQIDQDKEAIESFGLMIEPHLLLYYPTAEYYFVNKINESLAERLEKGFSKLQENGEMEKMFFSMSGIQAAMTELKNTNRQFIVLNNPDLPEGTKIYPPSYWKAEALRH